MIAGEALAAWLAFAGKAFLSTDAGTLRAMLEALRAQSGADPELARLAGDLDSALRDGGGLETAYVSLFLDPAGAPCPPWQSAHQAEPQLMGPAHHSALAWYRSADIEPRAENEPADHVGLLLVFAGSLIRSDAAREEIEAFHKEHLEWMPAFCECVARQARHPFYALLADLTRRLVERLRPSQP